MTLYHPTCLTRIEGKDRVCEHCWETHRESTGSSETTQKTINDDESAQVLHKDTDIPKSTMTEVRKTTEAEDSDSSDTSTTVSDYNPIFRPSPAGRRQQQLPAEKQPTSKSATMAKTSPLQTRAARKAGKTVREDAFDTSEEEDNE